MYSDAARNMYYLHEVLSQLFFKYENVDVADDSVSISIILENSATKYFFSSF